MLIPLSWLKKFIDLDLTPHELEEVLTLSGLEVDSIQPKPLNFTNVVVGEVLETAPHPDAEKLTVAQVSDGEETVQVVCGAPNCRPGMKTAFARVGGKVGDMKIKKAKLRGVESKGMLCGEDELELGEDKSGIIELDLAVGTDLSEHYSDLIIEISLTPNLGHCASVLGVARELAALLEKPLKLKKPKVQEVQEKNTTSVQIEDEHCYHYACRKMRGVKVGPTPDFIKTALEDSGIRSLNNIVDVTNYVMLELGQPMHAFDAKHTDHIVVKKGKGTLKTLDDVEREIREDVLLICSDKSPLAVAGVMGGASSAICDETTDILLEAAWFDASDVRRSSKALNLRTESSSRFERGIDPEGIHRALDRAAELILEVAGGELLEGIAEKKTKEVKTRSVPLRFERVNALLGTQLSENEIESFLKRLDMPLKNGKVSVPSYRNDIQAEIDLIEEVARVYGYNNIERSQPIAPLSPQNHSTIYQVENEVRDVLLREGLQEFLCCDLISPKQAEVLKESELIKVLKPSSVDQSVLRTSLLPGLLQSIRHNFDHRNLDINAFEIGRIHFRWEDGYKERLMAGVVMTGKSDPHHYSEKPSKVDFFDLKGVLENVFKAFNMEPKWICGSLDTFHPGVQANLEFDDQSIGTIGEVHPTVLTHFGIEFPVYFAEIDLHAFTLPEKRMSPLPQFPAVERDWTVTLERETPIGIIEAALSDIRSKLLASAHLIDLFESEKLGADKKNATFRFNYRHEKKTLKTEDVDREHSRIVDHLRNLLQRIDSDR
ncbi:MAG: Phenylalanine--tRNA ligase beta subunit [Chlamydiia bacterium]|nr:Phenylalanine--tRNA ligase beta subunit [Chlamydiia bacterium]MCH9615056.1 Phenylalanine--tRNA ligase beta subunit [Chlamydiia bacterium]MCH9629893.1 Phenylalanine--tRNA ligase beta subunit [Chlamydiia bacterium]